jgi:hypothetical protein
VADDPARLSDLMESCYRDNWSKIRAQLTARVDGHLVDDHAKQAFHEALRTRSGYYFLICRGVFPEIERVARIELCHGMAFQNIMRGSSNSKNATRCRKLLPNCCRQK